MQTHWRMGLKFLNFYFFIFETWGFQNKILKKFIKEKKTPIELV